MMSEETLWWIEYVSGAWEDIHRIVVQALNDRILPEELRIEAPPPCPNVKLGIAFDAFQKGFDRLLPFLPKGDYQHPWIVGEDMLLGSSGSLAQDLSFFTSQVLKGRTDIKWLREKVVTPVKRNTKTWRGLFDDLWRRFSREVPTRGKEAPTKPYWDQDLCCLWFKDKIVRRIRSRSVGKNVVSVLDAFQKQGWCQRIDAPLGSSRSQQRLHETIRSLNEGLDSIRFRADGTGKGIRWEPA